MVELHRSVKALQRYVTVVPFKEQIITGVFIQMGLLPVLLNTIVYYTIILLQFNHVVWNNGNNKIKDFKEKYLSYFRPHVNSFYAGWLVCKLFVVLKKRKKYNYQTLRYLYKGGIIPLSDLNNLTEYLTKYELFCKKNVWWVIFIHSYYQ